MPFRTCSWTLCRTSQRLVHVSPAEITSMERRNLVRILSFIALARPGHLSLPSQSSKLLYEFVAHSMHGAEVRRVRGISLQLLSQLQNVIINRTSGGVVLISPDLIQQFVARNDTFRVLRQKFQRLKLLRGQENRLSFATHFHLGKVYGNPIESNKFGGVLA